MPDSKTIVFKRQPPVPSSIRLPADSSGARYCRWLAPLTLAVFSYALVACTTPPIKEFQGYAEAFEEVRATTYVLIQDCESAISKKSAAPAVAVVAQPPAAFDPAQFRRSESATDADQRRRSIDAVVRFNESMLSLARGSSLDSVKATLKPLSALLKFSAPQFSAAAPLIEGLIGKALKARDNTEFIRAFKEVTVGGPDPGTADCLSMSEGKKRAQGTNPPIIVGILEHLCADTVEYYAVQAGKVNGRLNELADVLGNAGGKIATLGDAVKRPDSDSAQGARLAALEAQYHSVRSYVIGGQSSGALVSVSGHGPYTDITEASIEALMEAVRGAGEKARVVKQGLSDYHAALGRYVELLDKTILLLHETETAAARPPDVFSIAERLSVIRTSLDSDAIGTREAILRAISALR